MIIIISCNLFLHIFAAMGCLVLGLTFGFLVGNPTQRMRMRALWGVLRGFWRRVRQWNPLQNLRATTNPLNRLLRWWRSQPVADVEMDMVVLTANQPSSSSSSFATATTTLHTPPQEPCPRWD